MYTYIRHCPCLTTNLEVLFSVVPNHFPHSTHRKWRSFVVCQWIEVWQRITSLKEKWLVQVGMVQHVTSNWQFTTQSMHWNKMFWDKLLSSSCIRIDLSKVFFKHIHTHLANPYLSSSSPSTFCHLCSDGSFRVLPWLWKFGCDLFGYGPSTLGWLPTWKRPMLAAQQGPGWRETMWVFWDRMHEKNPEIIDWPTMKPGVAMITFWGSCFFFYMTYQGALKWWYIIHLFFCDV